MRDLTPSVVGRPKTVSISSLRNKILLEASRLKSQKCPSAL